MRRRKRSSSKENLARRSPQAGIFAGQKQAKETERALLRERIEGTSDPSVRLSGGI